MQAMPYYIYFSEKPNNKKLNINNKEKKNIYKIYNLNNKRKHEKKS